MSEGGKVSKRGGDEDGHDSRVTLKCLFGLNSRGQAEGTSFGGGF